MEAQKLIQVSIQLPASELGRLSSLLEQFQRVLASGQAEAGTIAQGSTAAERGENASFDQTRFSALSDVTETRSSAPVQAVSVQASAETDAAAPASAAYDLLRQLPEAAAFSGPTLSELSAEPEQDALPPFRPVPDVPAIRFAAGASGDAPPSAGFAVADSAEGTSGVGAMGIEERLTAAGPAPLTAEAVSQTFRRDDRRYDNGFPLY